MTYAGFTLTESSFVRVGKPTAKEVYAYNPDGTLASVTRTLV